MTIDKAIELLTGLSIPGSPDLNTDDFDAIKLGIEALKKVKRLRNTYPIRDFVLLSGETKE